MENQLTAPERTDLRKLCKIVEDGLGKFIEVGSALLEINERKLYRESHKTFEAFVFEKFGISRAHAYRMIEAAEVQAELSPIWGQAPIANEIKTEGQLRELAKVGTEALPEIVEKIAEKCEAEGCKPTAKVIKSVVDEALGKEPKQPKKAQLEYEPEPAVDTVEREERHLRLARQHLNGLRLALSNLGAGRRFDEYWANVENWLDG
jgi:hypothetical protein